jgi:hypothetical protein
MNTIQTTIPAQTKNSESPCRCHEKEPAPCTCCGITCFDRPNYFCGHLLTDADLSLEQKYVREKNKLYHRAIDGYGIACGLKITCDPQCKGFIRIHEGFAIDDCGHDLVVCETLPFDVIGTLKKKGLLVVDEPQDECEPSHRKPRCEIKQCFYVTICYDEEESNYETPFQSGCTSGPKECLPTRTKERVRFDVTDKLPPEHSYLTDLEERFKHCFEIYSDGPIGRIMTENIADLRAVVEGRGKERGTRWDPCKLFCELRAYFLNRLKVKPDEFNCGLIDEVYCLTCPPPCQEDEADEGWESYYKDVQEAFRKLLTYMQRYQFDCAFGELIFGCHETCHANCLVLGTVEVIDGKLMRVCNTPRKYLLSAANLVPALMYNLFNKHPLPAKSQNECEEETRQCCPDYPRFEPGKSLNEFLLSNRGRFFAATSMIKAFEGILEAFQRAADFTDSDAISLALIERVLKNVKKTPEELKKEVEELVEIKVTSREETTELRSPYITQALSTNTLLQKGDTVVAFKNNLGEVTRVLPDYFVELFPDREFGRNIEANSRQVRTELEELNEKLGQQAIDIARLKAQIQGQQNT